LTAEQKAELTDSRQRRVVVTPCHDAHVAKLVEGEVLGADAEAEADFVLLDLE